jgi:hypothetical protein
MQKCNNKEALSWLSKFVIASEGEEQAVKKVGLVVYAVCLNRLGLCRQSMYYLKQAITVRLDRSREAECLFYLTHNCYVL